ncbi:tetratricopeptide repeat protein [Gluconobacter cerinus]|uniref:Peptide transporter n=1 Tax=Gluconobacter cerinus TaxID=38307 RepID=A0AAV5NE26_9PROT|nr:tetratricopeptide repeat protein [Gluconobacter cerinus]GLQ62626.1 hypothetical protein GCM10007867_14710 [Gluconobacter cerinus]
MTGHYKPDPTRFAFDCFARGDLASAEKSFRDILAHDPAQPDAWHGMACLARARGQNATAIAMAGRALQAGGLPASRSARVHITLGLALAAEGHFEPARAALSVARTLQPADPRAHAASAEVFLLLGQRKAACETLEEACALARDDVEYLTRLGEIYLQDGRPDKALSCFDRVTKRAPRDGRGWANLGAAFFESRLLESALQALEKACELRARTGATLNSLGLVQMALGNLQEARLTLEEALGFAPEDARIANNLGTVLMEMGEEETAKRLFSAITDRTSGYEQAQARFNHATILLGEGEFSEGWQEFESRHRLLNTPQSSPAWDGSEGELPIVVTAEQGLGDSIQFLRFLPLAATRRPLRLHFPVAALVSRMPTMDHARILEPEGPVAGEISLLSLPFVLGLAGQGGTAPYLEAASIAEPRVVGLCWAGNPSYRFDRRRSLNLEWLEPLQRVEGIRFVSLQQGNCPEWMEKVSLETPEELTDAVGRCSLVISVDTAVAHMAGAVGRPLWLLNRRGGDWRWKTTPWYQNVRQFRPEGFLPEAWPPVVEQVAENLREWAQQQPS